jgi:hypothetical protein
MDTQAESSARGDEINANPITAAIFQNPFRIFSPSLVFPAIVFPPIFPLQKAAHPAAYC